MRNNLVFSFLYWFYVLSPRDIVRTGNNFMIWAWRFFSVGYLPPRLLSPWHKDISGYGRGFDFKRFFHVFGWNLISRIIGAMLRIVVIIIGLSAEIITIFSIFFVFLVWVLLPAIIIMFFVLGISAL